MDFSAHGFRRAWISSVGPTYGDQEGAAYNDHFGRACYHPLADQVMENSK